MYPPPKYSPSNYTYHLSLHLLALTLGCFLGSAYWALAMLILILQSAYSLLMPCSLKTLQDPKWRDSNLFPAERREQICRVSSTIIALLQLKKLLNMLLSLFVCREELLQVTSMPTTQHSVMFLQDRREREKDDDATLPRSWRSATPASHGDGIYRVPHSC